MEINKTQKDGKTILALSGRLDTLTAPQLQDSLLNELSTVKDLELDFSNLAYVSSAGLRSLLVGQKTAKSKKAVMTLTNVSDSIMEVFNMTGFTSILNIKK